MTADPSTPTSSELRREASPCLANTVHFALHPRELWKCSRPHGANDVSQYGGIANWHVALAGAISDVEKNLNTVCYDEVEC